MTGLFSSDRITLEHRLEVDLLEPCHRHIHDGESWRQRERQRIWVQGHLFGVAGGDHRVNELTTNQVLDSLAWWLPRSSQKPASTQAVTVTVTPFCLIFTWPHTLTCGGQSEPVALSIPPDIFVLAITPGGEPAAPTHTVEPPLGHHLPLGVSQLNDPALLLRDHRVEALAERARALFDDLAGQVPVHDRPVLEGEHPSSIDLTSSCSIPATGAFTTDSCGDDAKAMPSA